MTFWNFLTLLCDGGDGLAALAALLIVGTLVELWRLFLRLPAAPLPVDSDNLPPDHPNCRCVVLLSPYAIGYGSDVLPSNPDHPRCSHCPMVPSTAGRSMFYGDCVFPGCLTSNRTDKEA